MDLKWIVAAFVVLTSVVLFSLGPAPNTVLSGTLLIAQGESNKISLLNLASGKLDPIDAGPLVHGVGVLPEGSKAYAASLKSDEISVVDLVSKQAVASIAVGGKTHHIEVSPNGRWVYATLSSTNAVVVIDTTTDTVSATVPVAPGPSYTVFTPDGTKAYVTSRKANSISVIDTGTMQVLRGISVDSPDHLALSMDGLTLYATDRGSNQLSVIDTVKDELITTIPVGKGPHGVAVVERKGVSFVVVGNRGGTTLSLIDATTNKVVKTVELEVSPEHLTASSDHKILYVGSVPAKSLLVFDVLRSRVVKRIDVKGEIHQIVVVSSN